MTVKDYWKDAIIVPRMGHMNFVAMERRGGKKHLGREQLKHREVEGNEGTLIFFLSFRTTLGLFLTKENALVHLSQTSASSFNLTDSWVAVY